MKSRGSERGEDGHDERREPRGKGRRWGRGKPEPAAVPEEPEVSGEELGWIADLRTAKEQQADIGPAGGTSADPPVRPPSAYDRLPELGPDSGGPTAPPGMDPAASAEPVRGRGGDAAPPPGAPVPDRRAADSAEPGLPPRPGEPRPSAVPPGPPDRPPVVPAPPLGRPGRPSDPAAASYTHLRAHETGA
ncbi:hypothetical protein I0C86_27345 [Plantactinospora sp. S1510]|uniref:Uncharacterized protein n=1 Tax=Plantactinospora alkalitolerans TaxID=2789879 RepID=A0ABS0H2F0_9ACTN|nr:hypothetical protein [Plantactinospora alkalitolerans]MBF9132641.1 hypothetical protein [Plantactinospora alkalitolerans]